MLGTPTFSVIYSCWRKNIPSVGAFPCLTHRMLPHLHPQGPVWTGSHCLSDLLPFARSLLAQEVPLCSEDTASMLLPQGLCTCYFLCLKAQPSLHSVAFCDHPSAAHSRSPWVFTWLYLIPCLFVCACTDVTLRKQTGQALVCH